MARRYLRAGVAVTLLGLVGVASSLGGAAPAMAANVVATQKYVIGNGSVSNVTAVAQPGTAGATANYTVGFTTPSALPASSGTITISDTAGATTFPSSTTDYFVVDPASLSSNQPLASANLGPGGHSVTLVLSASVPAGTSLSVYMVGVTNPTAPGLYSLGVATSANQGAASSPQYQIAAAASSPAFDPVAAPPLAASAATYTIGVFKAVSAVAVGGGISISSYAPATTGDNVSFPSASSAYTVTDLTTGSSSSPESVAISGVGAGLSGQTVSLELASAVAAGDELSVGAKTVRNPSSTQLDTFSAAAPASAPVVTATVQIGTSVTSPTVSLSQGGAGTSGALYIIGFKTSSAVAAGGNITVVAPPGTSFSAAGVTVVDATHASGSANVPASSLHAAATGTSLTDNQLRFSTPVALGAGDSIFVELSGVGNPPAGSYGGPAGNFTVATSGDVVPASVPAYVVSSAPTPVLASIEVSPPTPGTLAQYAISDMVAQGPLTARSATVELRAPSGTAFPASLADYTVADLGAQSGSAHPSALSGGGTSDVVIMLGASIASGSFVEILVTGVMNPPAGNYQLSVIGDLAGSLAPSQLPPPAPVTATTTSLSSSPNPAAVGQTVTYASTVFPTPKGAGTVRFSQGESVIPGCASQPLKNGTATCTVTYWDGGSRSVQASFLGVSNYSRSVSPVISQSINFPATGYWLLTRSGSVYAAGSATAFGGVTVSASTGPVVGIASTPTGAGYWVVTSDGNVFSFGDARNYGDLPGERVATSDIVAIAPTFDGRGYWLVGRDGGLFTFGDAHFHGSVPGLHKHVRDVVGMVASLDGAGYLLVGSDGGVFTFGSARFYGSVPGLGKHISDVRAILPASNGDGYVLVGADGGAFVFGKGVHFLGSLPGKGIRVDDIVGLALSPDNGGYFMASSNGTVYGFGDAVPWPMPSGVTSGLPVVAIAGT